LILERKSEAVLQEVLDFANKVGLPTTLAGIGLTDITAEMLDRIAARSTAAGETIHNEPFTVEPRMVVEAIRTADALGRDWQQKHGVSAMA